MSTFTYKTLTALALTGALLAAPAFAEEAHHSQGAATPPATAGQGMGMMGGMDMGKMHEMMQQMHAAKTPEEKQKIRAEHHKAMQEKWAPCAKACRTVSAPWPRTMAPNSSA